MPCTQTDCENGSTACCLPAFPGVWDPALQACFCPPPPLDGGADADADDDAGTGGDAGADADPDDAAEAETADGADADDDAGVDSTVGERASYPGRPYGLDVGDRIKNYSFLTSTGRITLQDVRLSRAHSILLLYLGSASCTWCSTETPELNTIYAEYEPRGLEIFGVLADDDLAEPTGASADEYFRDHYGAEYPYGANAWTGVTLMSELYPDGNVALPENFVIDLESMIILERMDGYPDTGGLAPFITPHL